MSKSYKPHTNLGVIRPPVRKVRFPANNTTGDMEVTVEADKHGNRQRNPRVFTHAAVFHAAADHLNATINVSNPYNVEIIDYGETQEYRFFGVEVVK